MDSANSPALILVYNKCGLDEQFDIDRCTADFFSNEENTEILQLYSDVKVRSGSPGQALTALLAQQSVK